jgi:ABC-type multidrug transport system ATPase subunit
MIQADGVKKRFGAVTALNGVTLSIAAGERIAFVGTNGSGKTTLLRALLGLIGYEGKVHVAGMDVARQPERVMRSVAYIPQIAPPIDASVAEVVRACAALRKRDAADIARRAERLGLSVGGVSSKRFRDLSGGMKQKLLAAIALAAETPILVCDEPTANLDAEARASFVEQLEERSETAILLLCSHRLEEVRHMVGRVVELADGRVVHDSTLNGRSERTYRVGLVLAEARHLVEPLLRELGFTRRDTSRYELRGATIERAASVARRLSDYSNASLRLEIADDIDIGSQDSASGFEKRGVA